MKKEKKSYLDSNDFIQDFVSEYCVLGADRKCKRKDILESLKKNYPNQARNIKDADLVDMLTHVDGVKYEKARNGNTRILTGIDLATEQELDFSINADNDIVDNFSDAQSNPITGVDLQSHADTTDDKSVEATKIATDIWYKKYDVDLIKQTLLQKGFPADIVNKVAENFDTPF